MIKYDHNYCKPDADMRPLYCPVPLAYDIPHHEEWDEPIIDPETGEPTGETEHMERDWTEHKIAIHPNAEDKALAGYRPLSPDYPVDPAQYGQHWERTGKIEANGDDGYRWVYTLVADPPPPPRVFSKLKVVAALTKAGVWPQVKAWIEEAGLYDLYLAAQEFAEDNEYFTQGLAALKPVVGWTDEQVEALLSQCVKEVY